MHICFVDESGTPAKPGQNRPEYFVIAGLIVPEERWHAASDRLRGLKVSRGYQGELKWRFFAPANQDADNPMRAWGADDRNSMRQAAFRIITQDRSIRIVACVCQASAAYQLPNVNSQQDIYFGTYKVVTERFQYQLQDITRASGHRTLGLIVADHRGKGEDERMRTQHQRLIDDQRQYTSTYTNLIEGVFLTPSHLSVGIQLVDIVAGAIWRRFEHDDGYWMDQIRPSIRSSADGRIDGYGIARFPNRGWTGRMP